MDDAVRPLARLSRPRTDDPARLAVLADPHVTVADAGTDRPAEGPRRALEAAVGDVRRRDVDAVVCVGDLTGDGARPEYAAADDLLAPLSVPFVSVPGNHDVPKAFDPHDGPDVRWFAERYGTGSYPATVEVGGVTLCLLDSAGHESLASTHDGYVPPAQAEWLADALDGAAAPLVVCHHPPAGVEAAYERVRDAAFPDADAAPPRLRDPGPLRRVLAAGGAPPVLSGHVHVPVVERADCGVTVSAPTTSTYPQGYLLVTVGPDGTAVDLVPVCDRKTRLEALAERRTRGQPARALLALGAETLHRAPLSD